MAQPNPAQQPQTPPMDGDVKLWACDQRDPRTLDEGLTNVTRNLRYTDGLPETRKGVVKPTWANRMAALATPVNGTLFAMGTNGTPYGSGVFRDPNSLDWQLTAVGGYVWYTRPGNPLQSIPMPPGVMILGRCKPVQAFDRVFLFRGRELAPLMLTDLSTGWLDILPHFDATQQYLATVVATGQTADEIAYGPFIGVTSLTVSGNTATVVTTNEHGYITGADITFQGAVQAAYNGRFNITVVDESTFTFQIGGAPASPANTQAITSLTHSTTTATATTPVAHGLTTGQSVTIAGATPSLYNGKFIITVTGTTTFTYVMPSDPGANATGTLTVMLMTLVCSNMIFYWQALGSQAAISTITRVTTTATVTTTANHGFSSGQYVTVTGATPPGYDGTFPITVTGPTTFTYTMLADPGASATGTAMLATTSVVFAGQSPDTHPEAWTRTYNILPNANTALFINNLLLVPTAYQPASVDNYTTFNGGGYTKVDFIVATDFQDFIHFQFQDEFRINQGGSDEIVDLFKFGPGSVIVLKDGSWGVLSAVSGDISQITLDMRNTEYGCIGQGAWAMVGSNAYFLSVGRGVMTIRQSDLGELLGVDVPLSAPMPQTLKGIDWTAAETLARMDHWDNKLYVAVPMKDGTSEIMVFDFIASVRLGNSYYETGVMVQGWAGSDTGSALAVAEFHQLKLNGETRLFFLDQAGYVNLVEESIRGDMVTDATSPSGVSWQEITSYGLSRTYNNSLKGLSRPVETGMSLMTWNPNYTIKLIFAGVSASLVVANGITRDVTKYFKPFNQPRWDQTNVNDDWARPYRHDYRVIPSATGKPLIPTSAKYVLFSDPAGGHLAYAYSVRLVTGRTYQLTTDGTPVSIFNYDSSDGAAFGGHTVLLTLTPGVLVAFKALGDTLEIDGPAVQLVNAQLNAVGFYMGSGVQLSAFQDALDQRNASNQMSKSYQLEFTCTRGRMRLVGQRVSSEPGLDRKGVLP